MGLNKRVRELREAAGLTQESLARAADVSVSTVVKLERGAIDPAWSTVLRLAKGLGVAVGELADGGEGPDRPGDAIAGAKAPKKGSPATPPADELQEVEKKRARKRQGK
jgi:transcriptional regulator with XRE-family HTH domain